MSKEEIEQAIGKVTEQDWDGSHLDVELDVLRDWQDKLAYVEGRMGVDIRIIRNLRLSKVAQSVYATVCRLRRELSAVLRDSGARYE